MKPRLLFVYPNQFGYHTDSYKYCEYLQSTFDIIYICFDQGFDRLVLPGINVIYMPYSLGKIRRLLNFYSSLVILTWREKIDILFTIRFKYCFLIGIFARSRVKILDFRSGDLNSSIFKRTTYNILMRFDAIFFYNISVISVGLRRLLKLGEHAMILPLGADIISHKIRSFNRLDMIYVGTLSLRNIEQTIEGVSDFLNQNPELLDLVSYNIIGFGTKEEVQSIKECIIRSGYINNIHFLGRKKYTDLVQYLDTCNIGISYVPITPYYEFQPVTKLFEYMLSGMPVVATNTHENRLIVNETNGVLITDNAEAFSSGLSKLYQNRNSYNSDQIRESVESYTWENIVNNTLKPYMLNLLK
jgi:glycosyltransferase involved in cell wall biosynthesis